jgi:DNA-binding NarL/FixJ family response regulator
VRLVLCDDHRLFAEPFGAALTARGHAVVLTTTPAEGVAAVEEHAPDLFLVDLHFPEGDAFDVIATVSRRRPRCPVVVLSGSFDQRDVTAAEAAGAAAFLRKDQAVSVIVETLERAAAGQDRLPRPAPSPGGRQRWGAGAPLGSLTERERQVLDRLLEAEDTDGIARSLGVAPSTVRTHLQSVLLKLGVHNRLEAVNVALEAGLAAEP